MTEPCPPDWVLRGPLVRDIAEAMVQGRRLREVCARRHRALVGYVDEMMVTDAEQEPTP